MTPGTHKGSVKSPVGKRTKHKCPRCGAMLLRNDFDEYWCRKDTCTFGLGQLDDDPRKKTDTPFKPKKEGA